MLTHVLAHGWHSAAFASSAIEEAKVASLGLKPWGFDTDLCQLFTSAADSGPNPVLRPLDILDPLSDGDGDVGPPPFDLRVRSA